MYEWDETDGKQPESAIEKLDKLEDNGLEVTESFEKFTERKDEEEDIQL